jgi:hypothetical protein
VRLGEISVRYGVGTDPAGGRIVPAELRLVAPPCKNFAYDTILFVTLLRYVRLMQREEIRLRVFKGVPHRLCHFHFLKALGRDLLEEHHKRMCISVKRMKETLSEIRKKTAEEQAALRRGRTGRRRKGHYDCGWLLSAMDRINDSGARAMSPR